MNKEQGILNIDQNAAFDILHSLFLVQYSIPCSILLSSQQRHVRGVGISKTQRPHPGK